MHRRFPKCLEMDLVLVVTAAVPVAAAAAVLRLRLLEEVVPLHLPVPAEVEAKRPRWITRISLVEAIAAASAEFPKKDTYVLTSQS